MNATAAAAAMDLSTSGSRGEPEKRRFLLAVALIWVMVSVLLLWNAREAIAAGYRTGPDDLLRLVQVRDWLAGQAFSDVSQHRMNVPAAAPMHWSRLVDMPLALAITLLTPLIGGPAAEIAAMATVPLLTAFCLLLLTGLLVRRVAGETYALVAVLFTAAIPLVSIQIAPMRIDHHGWQLVAGLAATAALFGGNPVRAGVLAGLAMAAWLHISIEGLPYAAAIGAVLAARTLAEAEERDRLLSYAASLAGGAFALFALTQPAAQWTAPWCDALAPAYLGAFAAGATVLSLLLHRGLQSVAARAGVMAAAAGAGGAALAAINPACTAGPFAALDPLVHDMWYLQVSEGLPLWRAKAPVIVAVAAQLFVAALGYALALKSAASGAERRRWLSMAALFAAAAVVGLAVTRASAFALLLALPGTMALLAALMTRIRRLPSTPRIFGSAAAIIALLPVTPVVALCRNRRKQRHGRTGRSLLAGREPQLPRPRRVHGFEPSAAAASADAARHRAVRSGRRHTTPSWRAVITATSWRCATSSLDFWVPAARHERWLRIAA